MVLKGARVARDANIASRLDLTVRDGVVRFSVDPEDELTIDLTGYLLLPGLVNTFDRLDHGVESATEMPVAERLRWGGIRNLLCGVTTVAHQGLRDGCLSEPQFPVRVLREFGIAPHAVPPDDLARHFWKHPSRWPYLIAAGVPPMPIPALEKLGVLGPHTVLLDPLMEPPDIEVLLRRRCSVIWWPIEGGNADVQLLQLLPAAIGAGVTGADLLDEVRAARLKCSLAPEAVYRMVTSQAAALMRLRRGHGAIAEGGPADLVAVRDEGQTPADAIFQLRPQMVVVAGAIRLVSLEIAGTADLAPAAVTGRFRALQVYPREGVLVDSPPQAGGSVMLSGRPVSYSIDK